MAVEYNPIPPERDEYGPLEILAEGLTRAIKVLRHGNQPKRVLVRMENCPGDVNMEIEVTW